MGVVVNVYGTEIEIKDPIGFFKVEDWGTSNPQEQYWHREELPDFFDYVEYDKQGNLLLTEEQREYAEEEVRRCRHGFFFMNNGIVTYITGKHYFYLKWWLLEDGIYPDYRDTDRRYFLFLNHWENVVWCLGVVRAKKRREGASSMATSNLVYEAIFFKNSYCGLVSKTGKDSRDTFTDMVQKGYRGLPAFLQPKQLNDKDSVSEIVLAHRYSEANGHVAATVNHDNNIRSRINYMSPAINAYDRGRLSRIMGDEGGKWLPDVPFDKWVQIVSKCLVKGAKRVGFAEFPSTVNELTKSGGAQFLKTWVKANQFRHPGDRTTNRFVRYFSPAYEGLEGFIDKHGMSVVGEPTQEQYDYLVDKWFGKADVTKEELKLGAKAYLLNKRIDLQGDDLEQEMRDFPFDEEEAFMSALNDCAFSLKNLNQRGKLLTDNPIGLRSVLYYRDPETQKVIQRDAEKHELSFCWKFTTLLDIGEANKFKMLDRLKTPARTHIGAIAVDSYSMSQGGRKYGSKAAAWLGLKMDAMNPVNTGKAIGLLWGRPPEKNTLHEQVLLAAEYWGFKVWYEHAGTDDYLDYFRLRGKVNYLGNYPVSTIVPEKRETTERFKGIPVTPFSLSTQLDAGISYVLNYPDHIDFIDLIENLKIFDPYNRTSYDLVVSWLMLLVVLAEPVNRPDPRKRPLVRLYPNKGA